MPGRGLAAGELDTSVEAVTELTNQVRELAAEKVLG